MIFLSIGDFFRVVPKKRRVRVKAGRGIIYNNPPIFKKIIFWVGNVVLVFAVIYLGYLYYPLGMAIVRYKTSAKVITEPKVEEISKKFISNKFEIQVPKILANAEIVPDVSPFNRDEYLKVLERNVVAQAKTSGLPGDGLGKSIYIFAHSSQQGVAMVRNNSVFYLLGELNSGDVIYINYHDKIYIYKVYTKKIVSANDISYINYSDSAREVLILQTCWPIGTDWNRLLVFAERV